MLSSSRGGRTSVVGLTVVLAALLLPPAGRAEAARKHKAAKGASAGDAFSEVTGQGATEGKTGAKAGKKKRRDQASAAEAPAGKTVLSKAARREERALCQAALKKSRRQVHGDQLVEAKETLATCARPVCGPSVRAACGKLAASSEADLPSVVPVVSDAPSSDVAVKVDGQLLTAKVDGQAVAINPGRHELTFSTEDKVFATKNVVIEKGQKDQRITVEGPPSSSATSVAASSSRPSERKPAGEADSEKKGAAAPAEESASAGDDTEAASVKRKPTRRQPDAETAASASGTSWPTYALAGVGLLGVGGYGALTWKGRQENQGLKDSCAPDCKTSSVHRVRMIYLAADISLAVGVVALATSTYLYFRHPAEEGRSTASLTGIRTFDLRPTAGGTLATIGGSF